MDGEDLSSPMNVDAVKKYFAKKNRPAKSKTLRGDLGKNGHPSGSQKEKVQEKIRNKIKRNEKPAKLKILRGNLGKKGYPGRLKT